IGDNFSSNNIAVITGPGSAWTNKSSLYAGLYGPYNHLIISNSAVASCDDGTIGSAQSATNCDALVTGPGSAWNNQTFLYVGLDAAYSHLVVSNSAVASCRDGRIGAGLDATNCDALVTGAGSLWSNRVSLNVGSLGGYNKLIVTNAGTVLAI